mgnify:CR=1 FL=1
MSEWETKIEAIANSTIPVNVQACPAYVVDAGLIKRVLEKTGKQALEEYGPTWKFLPRWSRFHSLS